MVVLTLKNLPSTVSQLTFKTESSNFRYGPGKVVWVTLPKKGWACLPDFLPKQEKSDANVWKLNNFKEGGFPIMVES